MKKNLFLALAVPIVIIFSSCSNDVELAGTRWNSRFTSDVIIGGITGYDLTSELSIHFFDATNYTMANSWSITDSDHAWLHDTVTTGTYTFDGENGMFDGEQPFIYNKMDNTITTTATFDGDDAFGQLNCTHTLTQQ